MILQQAQFDWNLRVVRKARDLGWSAFEQTRLNQRGHDPSLILTRNDRIVAVWLRTGRQRQDRRPPLARYQGARVECHLWYPPDWPEVLYVLTLDPEGDDAGPASTAA